MADAAAFLAKSEESLASAGADLEAGRYEITCAIPGHVSLGMTGTLDVG